MLRKHIDQFQVHDDHKEIVVDILAEDGKTVVRQRRFAGAGSQYRIDKRQNGYYYWTLPDGIQVRTPVLNHLRSRKGHGER